MTLPLNKNRWFVLGPRPAKPQQSDDEYKTRLFCFSCAGGNASLYNSFFHALGSTVQVVAVTLPGRMPRFKEPPLSSMDKIVQEVVREITPYLDKPFKFFGHSMGATVAFEVSLAIKAKGLRTPTTIYASAHRAPRETNQFMDGTVECVSTKTYEQLIVHLRKQGGTPEELLESKEMMDMVMPAIRCDYGIAEKYTWNKTCKTTADVIVCYGDKDFPSSDKLEGWKDTTEGKFEMHKFTGGHFYIHESDQLVKFLTKHLQTT